MCLQVTFLLNNDSIRYANCAYTELNIPLATNLSRFQKIALTNISVSNKLGLVNGSIKIPEHGFYAMDLTITVHTVSDLSSGAYVDVGIGINEIITTHAIHNNSSMMCGLHDCFNVSCVRQLAAGDIINPMVFLLQESVLVSCTLYICKI